MAESTISGFNINSFAENIGNVASLNQYYASITLPQTLQNLFAENDQFIRKIGFAIEAVNVPVMTVTPIDVNFRNAKIQVPGDRDQSGTWNLNVRADVNNVVRDVLERWNDGLTGQNEHDTLDDENYLNLVGQGEVHQLSKNSRILKSWAMTNVWPTEIGELSFDWTAENSIVKFPLTFSYQAIESNTTRNNVITERDALSGTVVF